MLEGLPDSRKLTLPAPAGGRQALRRDYGKTGKHRPIQHSHIKPQNASYCGNALRLYKPGVLSGGLPLLPGGLLPLPPAAKPATLIKEKTNPPETMR